MKVTYRLEGQGCARATVTKERQSAELTASYLSDALGDVIEAVAASWTRRS